SGWGGLQISTNGQDQSLGADFGSYSRLVFKVYATEEGQSLVFRVNNGEVHWEGDQALDITPNDWELGDWVDIEIPLNQLFPTNPPSTIWRIDFQIEQGVFYVDEMGFL